ncbi:hypothetical protein O0I10_007577 [Lichtheimia ornata]|uniref:Uncharacterized protein n=1 Tax=Lichtheimia ornata TaxID=688661 RepID=A0AAD7V1W0_9FUNG|nr:uncharacterized protein O0I10_007577 [Lichtheimia ornata]KAJ8656730.1 hypothetical protein O0I10_007577 [Lichtheimia ornata]
MSHAERADQQGAEVVERMVFDEEEGLPGFHIKVADECPFLVVFLEEDIIPLLVKIKPVGEVSPRVQEFIQEVDDRLQNIRDD